MFLISCGKNEQETSTAESAPSATEKEISCIDSKFIGEAGYIVENQLWDYRERFDTVYQWAEDVYLPFEKIEGGEVSFISGADIKNQGWLVVDGVTQEDLKTYIADTKEQGYSVWESETSINVYKDGVMMFMVIDNEKVYPYVFTVNVKADRAVSIADVRKLIEEQGLLDDYEYFDEYCVIAIENASVREQGLYEFIVRSARNDNSIYNMPFYLITDDEKICLFEQEVFTGMYPASACIYNEDLMLTYVKNDQGDGPSVYASKYILENGVYVQESETKLRDYIKSPSDIAIGKIENGEYKLYGMKYNEEAEFPVARKDMWLFDKEYEME